MLRALIWKLDAGIRQQKKTLETGHDLRELFQYASPLFPSEFQHEKKLLDVQIQHVGRLWYNNMRFASSRYVETRWFALGEVNRKRTMKQATALFFDVCGDIVSRCEVICGK
ncbi:MAG TPA: hypothetical protein VFE47_20550 [Tepidisphaeraceae bacterium]|jgi:hypothetical protein|nr:hypothetical protein [Tepidisphaeraceae bacterium]